MQNSRFLVIQNPQLMEELNGVIRDELAFREPVEGEMMAKGIRRARQDGYHFIFHAPTLISAVAPRNHSNSMANCCTGLENIQLAAVSLGLGACWSNQLRWRPDCPGQRDLIKFYTSSQIIRAVRVRGRITGFPVSVCIISFISTV